MLISHIGKHMKALTITESADTGLYQLIPPLPQLFTALPWSARSMHCNSCNVALQWDMEPTKTMPWNWRMAGRWGSRYGFRIVFGSFLGSGFGFLFGFLSWYHLPWICNSLELESVILHGICYILAWSLRILHAICYIWPCLPSILHGICQVLALQPLICYILVLQPFTWVSWELL